MAHHNRTPRSVLDAPSQSWVVTIPAEYGDRNGRRHAAHADRSKARRQRRAVTVTAEGVGVIWEPPKLTPEAATRRALNAAARKAKQAKFRARQAASVWPDGNRRSLSKSRERGE